MRSKPLIFTFKTLHRSRKLWEDEEQAGKHIIYEGAHPIICKNEHKRGLAKVANWIDFPNRAFRGHSGMPTKTSQFADDMQDNNANPWHQDEML